MSEHPGARVEINYGENLLPTNWNPKPVRGLIGYRCPVCDSWIVSYQDAGPAIDTTTGEESGSPGWRHFRPCGCWVDRKPTP